MKLFIIAVVVFFFLLISSSIYGMISRKPNAAKVILILFSNLIFCPVLEFGMQYTYEPQHEVSNNVLCATSKCSDQPVHKRSLATAFASRWNIL